MTLDDIPDEARSRADQLTGRPPIPRVASTADADIIWICQAMAVMAAALNDLVKASARE